MKQRINLYNPNKPKTKFEPLSLSGSITIAAASVIVFLILGLGLTISAGSQEDKLSTLNATKKRLDADVAKEQGRFANRQAQPELLSEQERLKREIAARQQLKMLLHKVQPAYGASFSSYLFALAESSVSESWFVEFQLDNEKRSFLARGEAVDGPAVPAMLEAIGRTETFQGMRVSELNVQALESGVEFNTTAELRTYE